MRLEGWRINESHPSRRPRSLSSGPRFARTRWRLLTMRKNLLRRLQSAQRPGGLRRPTRSRRSDNDSMPPNAIRTGPHQISSTSGL